MLQQTEVQPIQKAVMIIHQMSDDEKIQELARLREKALHDEASALSTARKEGREQGRAEGHAEGRAEGSAEGRKQGRDEREDELVKRMRENGIPEDQIQKIILK